MENRKKKIIWMGIGLATTGVIGYFGWQYWRSRKGEPEQTIPANTPGLTPPLKEDFSPVISPKTIVPKAQVKSEFPLKKGSRGEKVKALQNALIAKHGKTILPKYGADGDFGTELVNALKKLSLPERIDQSTFNVLVSSMKADYSKLASELVQAVNAKNFTKSMSLLAQISAKEDYSKVSDIFKQARIAGGVRQTLVNGMLNTFSSEAQKQAIRMEFIRMGLKYDGDKWSLSGLSGFRIITHQPALVWKDPKTAIQVPANMILGTEVSKRGIHTLFENNFTYFLVLTKSIKYL